LPRIHSFSFIQNVLDFRVHTSAKVALMSTAG
jgi:hypothetical protein